MKYVEANRLADLDVAARKLVEIANAVEAIQDDRLFIDAVPTRERDLFEVHACRCRDVRLMAGAQPRAARVGTKRHGTVRAADARRRPHPIILGSRWRTVIAFTTPLLFECLRYHPPHCRGPHEQSGALLFGQERSP